MFRPARRFAENVEHLEDVERIVRNRFDLAADDLVLVSEDCPRLPGFPARQTTALFWVGAERHRLVVFAPAAAVREGDLPPVWLRPSLIDDGTDCC